MVSASTPKKLEQGWMPFCLLFSLKYFNEFSTLWCKSREKEKNLTQLCPEIPKKVIVSLTRLVSKTESLTRLVSKTDSVTLKIPI